MREPAQDECGNTEQQWKVLAFFGKFDGSGHDDAATSSQRYDCQGARIQSLGDNGSTFLGKRQVGEAKDHGCQPTSDDVSDQNQCQSTPSVFQIEKSGSTCVQFHFIMYHRQESEREQYSSGNAANAQIHHPANRDKHTSQDGRKNHLYHSFIFCDAKVTL